MSSEGHRETLIRPYGEKARQFIKRWPAQDHRINILEGSVRSAKTWAMMPKIFKLCAYPVTGHMVMFGVTKQTVYRNVLSDLFDLLTEKQYQYNRQTGELWLMGRQWSVIGASDEGSEKKIRGMTVGAAVGDELTLMPKSFIMMLLNRMSPEGSRLYATTNPDNPFHYVKTEFLNPDAPWRKNGAVWSEHFTLDDNQNLDEEYKRMVKAGYSGVYKLRYIDGLWVVAEGAIFADALSEENYYDDSTAPANLHVIAEQADRGIPCDYGTIHPHVYHDVIDDGDTLWVDREYFWDSTVMARQKTDAQYADDLEAFMRGEHIEGATVHREVRRAALNAQVIVPPECASFKAELTQRGIWFTDADNAVDDGLRMMSNMLTRKKMKIHRVNCPNTIKQMQSYSWNPKAAQRGLEEPIKMADDAVDDLRYYVRTKIPEWRLAA